MAALQFQPRQVSKAFGEFEVLSSSLISLQDAVESLLTMDMVLTTLQR